MKLGSVIDNASKLDQAEIKYDFMSQNLPENEKEKIYVAEHPSSFERLDI